MATKKAKKKKSAPRAPRQVWLVLWTDGVAVGPFKSKREAEDDIGTDPAVARVVGPYVLAERARE